MAYILKLDSEKLRPDDRFDRKFSRIKSPYCQKYLAELENYMKEKCKDKIIKIDEEIETLNDVIMLLVNRVC
ncbi:MAG TPA: hypothetical protein DDZ80_29790 [Cyanobacteria bacterium UBA8803]|nr:hypothetical protein [Cyanobacteria bacterium UBA9273]HBL62433.1 hypothetical protein [Cyanobacteria bacterium UBA8803]